MRSAMRFSAFAAGDATSIENKAMATHTEHTLIFPRQWRRPTRSQRAFEYMHSDRTGSTVRPTNTWTVLGHLRRIGMSAHRPPIPWAADGIVQCRNPSVSASLQKSANGKWWEEPSEGLKVLVYRSPRERAAASTHDTTHATLTRRTPWLLAAVWRRTVMLTLDGGLIPPEKVGKVAERPGKRPPLPKMGAERASS